MLGRRTHKSARLGSQVRSFRMTEPRCAKMMTAAAVSSTAARGRHPFHAACNKASLPTPGPRIPSQNRTEEETNVPHNRVLRCQVTWLVTPQPLGFVGQDWLPPKEDAMRSFLQQGRSHLVFLQTSETFLNLTSKKWWMSERCCYRQRQIEAVFLLEISE